MLKQISRFLLKKELDNLSLEKQKLREILNDTLKEKEKLEKKIKKLENPENILLKYYRIDNIGENGIPPSYLNPQDKNDYTQKIHEIESIYRNTAFRELMAWSLNFHANLLASGKIKNEYGDEIEISSEQARYMIAGIKAIWEMVVAGHIKNNELMGKKIDPYAEDIIS